MTFSAPSLRSEGFQAVRPHSHFTIQDETAAPGLAKSLVARALRIPLIGVGIAASAGCGLALAFVGRPAPPVPPAPLIAVTQGPQAPAWTDVIRPFQAYDLTGGAFAKLPLTYKARRDAAGTGRQDILTYGDPVPGHAFLRLMFYRRGEESVGGATIFVDAARLAAGAGLGVTRSGLTSTLATRFGPIEVAGLDVARLDRSAICLAFRLANPATVPVLQMTGLACGTDERPVDLAGLACTIERLDLVSAGDDEALRSVFVAAERRRGLGCREEHGSGLRPGFPDDGRPVRSALKGLL